MNIGHSESQKKFMMESVISYQPSQRNLRKTYKIYSLSAFLLVALLLGGAGESYPLMACLVQISALWLPFFCVRAQTLLVPSSATRLLVWLPVAWLALMAGQLLPLPPAVWQNWPGRDVVAQLDRGMGWSLWRPLSLNPEATLDAVIGLFPAVLVWFATRAAPRKGRMAGLRVIVAVALASAGLGLLQIAGGADAPAYLWETAHRGLAVGLFVNRNHQAAFLLVAIALSGVRGSLPGEGTLGDRKDMVVRLFLGALVLLVTSLLATASRTGMALLPAALFIACFQRFRAKGRIRSTAVIIALALAFAAFGSGLAGQSIARFTAVGEDARWLYWQNSWLLLHIYLPYGAGFGTFPPIYQMVEPLDQVSPLYVPHAHSDWLEWVLEGGVGAILLLVAGLACFVGRAAALARQGEQRRGEAAGRDPMAVAGGAGVLLLILCSATDYPLRMEALSVLFAFCAALFFFGAERSDPAEQEGRSRSRLAATGLGAAAAAVLVLSASLSAAAVQAGDAATASFWAPWRGSAMALQAREAMGRGDHKAGLYWAERTLHTAPLDQAGVRIAGVTSDMLDRRAQARTLMMTAGMLGWRDPTSQAWLIMKADELGARDYEIQRIDALLRQHVMQEQALSFLVQLALRPDGAPGVVGRLRDRPGWRQGFLNQLGDKASTEPEALLRFVSLAQKAGVGLTVEELNLSIWRLIDADQGDTARQLWLLAGGKGLIGDAGFTSLAGRLPEHAGAFQWRSLTSDETQVFVEVTGSGSHILHMQSKGVEPSRALAQTLLLAPGHYQLGVDLASPEGGKGPMPDIEITCRNRDGTSRAMPLSLRRQRENGAALFDITPTCGIQELVLIMKGNDFQPFELAIGGVTIHALAAARNTGTATVSN